MEWISQRIGGRMSVKVTPHPSSPSSTKSSTAYFYFTNCAAASTIRVEPQTIRLLCRETTPSTQYAISWGAGGSDVFKVRET